MMDVESIALLLNTRSEVIELRAKSEEVKFLRAAQEANVTDVKKLTAELAVAKRDLEVERTNVQRLERQIATLNAENTAVKRDRDGDKALINRLEREVIEHHDGRKRLRSSYRTISNYIGEEGCDPEAKQALDSLRDHLKI
jgi:chromosome segregation ATPase